MSLDPLDVALYALGVLALFLTPGPVWVALMARALHGGFAAAWPLAAGVVVGDVLWPLLAILGVAWLTGTFAWLIALLKFVASGVFIAMGVLILRHRDASPARDTRLTRPGRAAGFTAGLAVILGNPKAILFYAGMLPGFFDLARLEAADIAVIVLVSAGVPLLGNLLLAASVDRIRGFLAAPAAMRRTNTVAGVALVCVGLAIPLL